MLLPAVSPVNIWKQLAQHPLQVQGNSLLEDDDAVEQVIREGRGKMPPVGKDWEDRQMDAVIDYLQEDVLRGG